MSELKVKFHIATQQYSFLEIEGKTNDLPEMEKIYQKYTEVPINFNKGKFVEINTYTNEVVRYNDLTHQYTDLEGNVLLSGSQFSKQLKPPFPKEKIIPLVAKKYGVKEATIDNMWSANGNISRTFGNAIHYAMEQWFKYKNDGCDDKQYHLPKHPFLREVVMSFPDADEDIIPEVVISDVKNKMVGRIDGLMGHTPIDYKSDADIQKSLKYHFMQLSFYATMLINHGHKVDKVIVWNYVDKWVKYESKVLKIK